MSDLPGATLTRRSRSTERLLRKLDAASPRQPDRRPPRRAAWGYREPVPAFAALRGHVAFYPGCMDACHLDDERVRAQPGYFYGGWITAEIQGPFKGPAGTRGW